MTILTIGVLVVLSLTLLYRGRAYWAWLIPGGLALVGWWLTPIGIIFSQDRSSSKKRHRAVRAYKTL